MVPGPPNPRVLVVDDEAELLHVLAGYLHRVGFDVTSAGDPAAALAALDTGPVDVVLTDLYLDGASGIALVDDLWTRLPDLPVVLMSGAAPVPPLAPGVTFVAKPFTLPEMAGVLRRALRAADGLAGS